MKKLLVLLVVFGIGLAALAYVFRDRFPVGAAAPKEPKTEVVSVGDISVKLTGTGKTVPKNLRYVGLDLPSAKVVWINPEAEIGKIIKQGVELARLELTTLETQNAEHKLKLAEASVQSAEAGMALAESAKIEAEAADRAAQFYMDFAKKEYDYAVKLGPDAKARAEVAEKALEAAKEKKKMAEAGIKKAEAAIKRALQAKIEADANLKLAESALKPISVKAPIDGVILEKKIMVGQPVAAQATPVLFAMAPLSAKDPNALDMQVIVPVPESDVPKILNRMREMRIQQKEMTAAIHFDAYPFDVRTRTEVDYEGDVVMVSQVPAALPARAGIPAELVAAAGPGQTMYTVTIENLRLKDPSDKVYRPIRAGFTANVDLVVNEVAGALRVPARALNYTPDKPTPDQLDQLKEKQNTRWSPLWLWENGQHRLIFVRRGESDGQWTQIAETETKDALKPGETKVVVEPPPAPQEKGLTVKTF